MEFTVLCSSVVLTTLLSHLQHHVALCTPEGCRRDGDVLACDGLKSFPKPFSSGATSVSIYSSNVAEIPAAAFKDVPNVEKVSIYRSQIGKIRGCAFGAKTGLKTVTIYSSRIEIIESYAFANVSGATDSVLSIYLTTVGTIEPYAFSNVRDFDKFEMYSVNVTHVQTYAFSGVRLRSTFKLYLANIDVLDVWAFRDIDANVNIYSSNISVVRCHTFDELFAKDFSFQLLTLKFGCDCKVTWLLRKLKSTPEFKTKNLGCLTPEKFQNETFTNLTEQQLCPTGTPTTCDSTKPAPPTVADLRCGSYQFASSSTWVQFFALLSLTLGKMITS